MAQLENGYLMMKARLACVSYFYLTHIFLICFFTICVLRVCIDLPKLRL